jgi:hypothetical protein
MRKGKGEDAKTLALPIEIRITTFVLSTANVCSLARSVARGTITGFSAAEGGEK